MIPTLFLAPLTSDAFAPFGEVFVTPDTVNGRIDGVAVLQNSRSDARPNLFLARSGLIRLPHGVARMESHPFSSQSFVPLQPATIVIVVANPGPNGQPDPARLQGFVAHSVGFSYRAGVWHMPLGSLGVTVPVLGFMYENGSPQDCTWAEIAPVTLSDAGQSLARST